MDFYELWALSQKNNDSQEWYIQSFLNNTPETVDPLICGEISNTKVAIDVLLNTPIEKFIDGIVIDRSFTTKDVFQYSKLHDAIINLIDVLYYEVDSISYYEAGKRLTSSSNEYACIKYGENHIKLANSLSLVSLSKEEKTNRARISSLGKVFIDMELEQKYDLIKRLAIRNPFVQSMIYRAKSSSVSYYDIASEVLSGQTIIRRKHNTEIILKLILGELSIGNNIRWTK